MRRQTGPTYSRKMREPALGALGSMSDAGVSRSSWRQVSAVAPTMPAAKSASDTTEYAASKP